MFSPPTLVLLLYLLCSATVCRPRFRPFTLYLLNSLVPCALGPQDVRCTVASNPGCCYYVHGCSSPQPDVCTPDAGWAGVSCGHCCVVRWERWPTGGPGLMSPSSLLRCCSCTSSLSKSKAGILLCWRSVLLVCCCIVFVSSMLLLLCYMLNALIVMTHCVSLRLAVRRLCLQFVWICILFLTAALAVAFGI